MSEQLTPENFPELPPGSVAIFITAKDMLSEDDETFSVRFGYHLPTEMPAFKRVGMHRLGIGIQTMVMASPDALVQVGEIMAEKEGYASAAEELNGE